MVCQSPGRSCVPASRGSTADMMVLSAAVMNPPSGLADQIKVQMVEEESQRRLVLLQDLGNEFAIHRLVPKQDVECFGPRAIEFLLANAFVAIAEGPAHGSDGPSDMRMWRYGAQVR